MNRFVTSRDIKNAKVFLKGNGSHTIAWPCPSCGVRVSLTSFDLITWAPGPIKVEDVGYLCYECSSSDIVAKSLQKMVEEMTPPEPPDWLVRLTSG